MFKNGISLIVMEYDVINVVKDGVFLFFILVSVKYFNFLVVMVKIIVIIFGIFFLGVGKVVIVDYVWNWGWFVNFIIFEFVEYLFVFVNFVSVGMVDLVIGIVFVVGLFY